MRIKSVRPENRSIENEPSFAIKRDVGCLIPVTWSVRERISRRYISSFYYIDVKCFHTTADYNDFDAPTQPTPLLVHLRFFGDFSGPPHSLPSLSSSSLHPYPSSDSFRLGSSSTAINIRAGRISLERVRFRRPLAASCPLLVRSRALLFFFVVLLFSGGSASHQSLFS